MNFISKIFKSLKSILLMPINIVMVIKYLRKIESKLDLLTQKVTDLEMHSNFVKQGSKTSYQALTISDKLPISKIINDRFENHFLQIESLLSIYNSLPNLKFMPATRGWAGSPDFLNKIVEIISKQNPSFVVEASSGVSSVLIGLALKKNKNGKLLSLEHDDLFSKITTENLSLNEIGDITTVVNCPIVDCIVEEQIWKWYDTKELTFTDKIDLLIIDGPPRTTQNLARYPAIPILSKYFSKNVTILLDDAKRPDEIIIVDKWIKFLKTEGYEVDIERNLNFEKGLVIIRVNRKF